ncbi:MAG: hypothetical protein JNN30_01445 [Rhodanobacteraceae bacterium]|nr:hypothetical protein [Rhodanobacteraceae bacterium]
MWKVVLGIVVVGLVAYKMFGARPRESVSATAGGADVYDGYLEVRMTMQGPQREIELVAFEERPNAADCQNKSAGAQIVALCPKGSNGVSCALKSVECSRELEPRYRKMFDRQPASVHYAHLQVDDPSGTPRRGLVLGWGMTEQESMLICNAIRSSAAAKAGTRVTCI